LVILDRNSNLIGLIVEIYEIFGLIWKANWNLMLWNNIVFYGFKFFGEQKLCKSFQVYVLKFFKLE
jgi:hypothetical protein